MEISVNLVHLQQKSQDGEEIVCIMVYVDFRDSVCPQVLHLPQRFDIFQFLNLPNLQSCDDRKVPKRLINTVRAVFLFIFWNVGFCAGPLQ